MAKRKRKMKCKKIRSGGKTFKVCAMPKRRRKSGPRRLTLAEKRRLFGIGR